MKSRYAFDNKFTSELQSKSKNWCKLKTLLYGVSIANCDAYLNNVSVLAIKLCVMCFNVKKDFIRLK